MVSYVFFYVDLFLLPQIILKSSRKHCYLIDKKQHAQHAAAARALDCLSFREGKGVDTMAYGLCKEEPYLSKEDAPPLPSSTPTMLLESKTELLLKQHSLVVDMDVQCDECDRIQDREAYRQTRVQKMPDTVYAETSTSAVA